MSPTPALNLYTISIPPMLIGLHNLAAVLQKASAYADAHSLPHATLLSASLIADMKPLPFQIQRVSDSAKGFVTRLHAADPVVMPDAETTFAELQARIAKTIAVLEAVKEADLVGKEGDQVRLSAGPRELKFTGLSYLQQFVLPNFYFHVVAAYAILRMKGVDVGKMDYLAGGNPKLGQEEEE